MRLSPCRRILEMDLLRGLFFSHDRFRTEVRSRRGSVRGRWISARGTGRFVKGRTVMNVPLWVLSKDILLIDWTVPRCYACPRRSIFSASVVRARPLMNHVRNRILTGDSIPGIVLLDRLVRWSACFSWVHRSISVCWSTMDVRLAMCLVSSNVHRNGRLTSASLFCLLRLPGFV